MGLENLVMGLSQSFSAGLLLYFLSFSDVIPNYSIYIIVIFSDRVAPQSSSLPPATKLREHKWRH